MQKIIDKEYWVYITKCIMGVLVCFLLYKNLPQYPMSWSLISVVLVLSPDNSNEQAFNRIKANLLGCTIGVLLYTIPIPELLSICLGVLLTIIAGLLLKTTTTIRSALAAVVIVLLQKDHGSNWEVGIERVLCVITGCIVALLITILFNSFRSKR